MGPSLFMAFFFRIQGVGVRPCMELVAAGRGRILSLSNGMPGYSLLHLVVYVLALIVGEAVE
jgi:hypothetical protein